MMARSSTGSDSILAWLGTLHPVLPCPFDAPDIVELPRRASTTMEQDAVPSPEPIVLGRHGVGIRDPADAVDYKHVSVLSWRQGQPQAPLAVLVRSVQGMGLGIPAVEGPHHADPFRVGCFHVELCGRYRYALRLRRDRTAHDQGNEDEDAR